MALKIRMKRMGQRNRPFYRLVVQDSAWRRDGKTVADVGWYDPVKNPAQLSFKVKEICEWLEKGAKPSETARSLLKAQGILDKFKSGEYKEMEDGSVLAQGAVADVTIAPTPEPEPEPAPMEETPAAEATPVEEPAAEAAEAPAQDSADAPAEEAPVEEAPAEEAKTE